MVFEFFNFFYLNFECHFWYRINLIGKISINILRLKYIFGLYFYCAYSIWSSFSLCSIRFLSNFSQFSPFY